MNERDYLAREGAVENKPAKPKTTLSFLAQQYGLTAEDCAKELGCAVEDIIVEPQPNASHEARKNQEGE